MCQVYVNLNNRINCIQKWAISYKFCLKFFLLQILRQECDKGNFHLKPTKFTGLNTFKAKLLVVHDNLSIFYQGSDTAVGNNAFIPI